MDPAGTTFDPNAAATEGSGVFGLPYSFSRSALVYLPVPWEATASYGSGAADGPAAILAASRQVDLYDPDVLRPYEPGLFWAAECADVQAWNREARELATPVIAAGGAVRGDAALEAAVARVNALGERVNRFVRERAAELLAAGKIVGVVGGDHSVPFGALEAVAERHSSFGILHVDAHLDLRDAYEGFAWSHASIMRNALERIPQASRLVQVGARDYCEEEWDYSVSRGDRVRVFSDRDCSRRKFEGASWGQLCREIVAGLPNEVWVSFDIDGLDPSQCPRTGTPVPGGLGFQEANHLLGAVARSGRRIIGFDLCEVAPGPAGAGEWDANVGARLLYKLTAWTLASQSRAKLQL